MINIPRYFIDNIGVVPTNELTIFNHSLNSSQNHLRFIIFVTSTLNNNDIFTRIFQNPNLKRLNRGLTYNYQNNNYTLMHLSISQYFKKSQTKHILISTYIDSDDIFEIENQENVFANYVLPWGTKRVDKWARTTRAININTGVVSEPYSLPQQVVIDSLNKIIAAVNLMAFNTTDIELVTKEFKQLRKNGIALNRDEIEAYLMTHTNHYSWTFVKQFRTHSRI